MTTQAITVSLADVLAYRHPGVIRRYAKEHDASPPEAEELFREMLKWLYLAYRSTTDAEGSAGCAMTAEIEKINHMWHTFLLRRVHHALTLLMEAGVVEPSPEGWRLSMRI